MARCSQGPFSLSLGEYSRASGEDARAHESGLRQRNASYVELWSTWCCLCGDQQVSMVRRDWWDDEAAPDRIFQEQCPRLYTRLQTKQNSPLPLAPSLSEPTPPVRVLTRPSPHSPQKKVFQAQRPVSTRPYKQNKKKSRPEDAHCIAVLGT